MVKPSDNTATAEIELVSTRKTKTVSGKSDLTYHLGKDEDSNIHIRIWVNSSNGFFSNEWIPLTSLTELLKRQSGEPFTSFVLEPLFSGKSSNTPGFMIAALLNEGLVTLEEGKKRKYVYDSADGLLTKSHEAKPRKTTKKATAKTVEKPSK
jgi:hypothetical protein